MSLKEELQKVLPKPGQVWWVSDKKIRFTEKKRTKHSKRPCLIVSTKECITHDAAIINVIPISTKGQPSLFRVPISPSSYKDTTDEFSPDPNQLAIIQFYQPVELKHLANPCGETTQEFYQSIVDILALSLIGHICPDLNE